MSRPLLIAESNPHDPKVGSALWPYPKNCAGDRLCRKVLLMDPKAYLRKFDRANLCGQTWSARSAEKAAEKIRLERESPEPIVLLGARVARAFGVKFVPFTLVEATSIGFKSAALVAMLPHPSGRCRLWNEPHAFERAHRLLQIAGAADEVEDECQELSQ